MSETIYIHGYSPEEQARLSRMNDLLNRAPLPELQLTGTEKILDVGSGMGHFTRAMAQSASSVLGIEYNPKQLSAAIELTDSPNITYRQGHASGWSNRARTGKNANCRCAASRSPNI